MELENLSVKDLKKLNYEELNDLSKKMKEHGI